MYVSKELALILKKKGLPQGSKNKYHEVKDGQPCNKTCFNHITHPCEHCGRLNGIYYPQNEEVIDWVFEWANTMECDLKDNTEWLQFWYTILLEHKFSLMYEFIGRLEEWFENNDVIVYPVIAHRETIGNYWGYYINTNAKFVGKFNYDDEFPTKKQAKHEAIRKCFELLKIKHD
jgi:hypothetical protein